MVLQAVTPSQADCAQLVAGRWSTGAMPHRCVEPTDSCLPHRSRSRLPNVFCVKCAAIAVVLVAQRVASTFPGVVRAARSRAAGHRLFDPAAIRCHGTAHQGVDALAVAGHYAMQVRFFPVRFAS
jgi:hypothetical protein